MRRGIFVTFIVFALLAMIIPISCDSTQQTEAEALIGPKGGVVEVTDPTSRIFGAKVVMPEGALESSELITISELAVGDSDPNTNSIVEIGPEGLNLTIAANVTVPYREETPNGILGESTNAIFKASQTGQIWEVIPTTGLDTEKNLVTGMVQSFSSFTVSDDDVRHETPEFIGTGYPLILVHGVTTALESPEGDCDSTFGSLKSYLADLGFDVWTFNYNTARWIEICAGNLGMAIEGILDRKETSGYSDGDHISVICHSMGGLVTRAYIQRYALKWGRWKWTFPFRETERVSYRGEIDSIIMTGVPNHGSIWGAINYGFAIGPEIEKLFDQIRFSSVEMIPGSDFLDNLNDTSRALFELPESIDYHNIHGHYFNDIDTGEENDGIVLRSSSELSEWEALDGYNIQDYTVEAAHVRLNLTPPLNWNPGIAYIDSEAHVAWEVIRSIFLSWDSDGDGIPRFTDNCPDTYNPDQADSDGDGIGDVCDADYEDLVDGVSEVISHGVPGPVQADEPNNWAPIVAGDENTACAGDTSGDKTFMMARTYEDGRVVIMGHDGLIGVLDELDNKQLVLNIVSWLDASDGKRVVFSTGHDEWVTASFLDPLKAELESRGYSFDAATYPISSGFLADRDVLIFGNAWGTISSSEIDAVENFVANGGGLFLIGLGWSWGHHHPEPIEEYPMMKLAVPYGVRWLECYLWDIYYDQTPIFNVFYPDIPMC